MEKLKINFTKKDILPLIIECLGITLGTFIMALGYKIFLTPHNIVPGGFMGVAQIIQYLLAKVGFTAISLSLWYIILNVFLYLFALKTLGFKFGLRAGVGIATYSLFVGLLENAGFIQDIITKLETESASGDMGIFIIYAIFGGVLMGIGMGLVFRFNGSTGGCDMVAMVTNKFLPTVTTGQIVLVVDSLVVISSAIAYQSIVLPLFALITIYIGSTVSDIFVDGVKSLRAYYILTDKKEELSEAILTVVNRGVTNIHCEGMFTRNDKDMLMVICRRNQINQLKKIVKDIDPNSFMFSGIVKEAYGNGFIKYEPETAKKISIGKMLNKKDKKAKQETEEIQEQPKVENTTAEMPKIQPPTEKKPRKTSKPKETKKETSIKKEVK